MKNFTNKVAAITGAGSGMGRELALLLARRGCALALSDIDQDGLSKTATQARLLGVKVTAAKLDVSDRDAVYAWADRVVKDHGKVNMIFNNAGVGLGATIEGVSYNDFEWLMNINFWGVVYGTKAFLPHLRASGEGHVINTSSVLGLAATPAQGTYAASKFAVRGFTSALRQELDMMQCGVSATCVHPGGIKTNIAKLSRTDGSVRAIGVDEKTATERYEQTFITTAESAALTILRAVEKNKRRVLIGPDARGLDVIVRLLPSLHERLMLIFTKKSMGAKTPLEKKSPG